MNPIREWLIRALLRAAFMVAGGDISHHDITIEVIKKDS